MRADKIIQHDKKFIAFFLIVMLLALGTIIFYCYCDDIRADEVFSYGFANNSEYLFMSRGVIEKYGNNGWISGDFIKDYYAVGEGERFNFMVAHRQARDDVHPPLYFMALNFACSFFPGQVTALPGHIINTIFALLLCIMIYMVSHRILVNRYLALMPVIYFIGTIGFEETTEYIRMYLPLCTITLVYMYLCILLTEYDNDRIWLYFSLGLTTTIGTLTHYYYYIICACTFLTTYCILVKKCTRKTRVKFFISQLIGAMISFCAYPYVIKHMLHSDRGQQAVGNLGNSSISYYAEHFLGFLHTFNNELFNYNGVFFIGGLTVIAIIAILIYKFTIKMDVSAKPAAIEPIISNNGMNNLAIVSIPAFLYWIILFKISYSYIWSYVSPVFAPFAILFCITIILLLHIIAPKQYICLSLAIAVLFYSLHMIHVIPNLTEQHNTIESIRTSVKENSEGRDCIFIYDEWSDTHYQRDLELMNFNQIIFLSVDELRNVDLNELLSMRTNTNNALAIYIRTNIPMADEIAHYIAENTCRSNIRLLSDYEFYVYIID